MGHEPFIGAWELVGSVRRDAQGNPAGEAFPGYVSQLIYAADGRMSAQLMGPGRPSLPPAALDDRSATALELKQAGVRQLYRRTTAASPRTRWRAP